MTKPATIVSPPLLKGKTEIIERGLIGIKKGAVGIRPQHIVVLRHQPQDLSKLAFALPDYLLRLLCSGHVGYGAHKFEILSRSLQRATYDVDVLHRPIRHQQTLLKIKIRSRPRRTVDGLLYAIPVVG